MSTTVYLSFASVAELHNNSQLTVSPIGELTNKARTYAKDPGVFSLSSGSSATVLFNFKSQTDNVDIVMPQPRAQKQIEISNWLVAQAKLGNITNSRANTLALLKQTFSNDIQITEVGEMVTNNQIWLPSFVSGFYGATGEDEQFYLWMADAYFRDQYPLVNFTVVHPIPLTEIDSLIEMNYQQLEARLAKETPDIIQRRTDELTNDSAWPYTERNIHPFSVFDLINTPNSVKAYWTAVEWGNGFDAEDQLYDQIQKEILEASKYPREKWEEVLPDLFNPVEFYALPYYNRPGLTNRTNGAKTYSPIMDRETEMELVDNYLTPNMSEDHVIKSMQVIPFLYKSLAVAFVGKTNNREALKKVGSLYPDYQLRPSLDPDFGEMEDVTMEFIIQMENLLAAGETVTDISLPPNGITRIQRFGKTYVGRRIGIAKFLVMTRDQMIRDGLVEA